MGAVAVHHVVTAPADAPVVVLSNSLGSTHTMWDAQADALAEHFRVVRYDTRGHGKSPVPAGPYDIDDLADDVVELLDTLDLVRPDLADLDDLRLVAELRDDPRRPHRRRRARRHAGLDDRRAGIVRTPNPMCETFSQKSAG